MTNRQSGIANRVAVYPGSFDPITKGHEDIIHRALVFADKVVVGVATSAAKQPLFNLAERRRLVQEAVGADSRITVEPFEGLLVDFARRIGATMIIRGLRYVSDFEYEYQMALMNRKLNPDIETMFLVPAFDLGYLSASLVREVARFGGDVSTLVHPAVDAALKTKLKH